MKSIELTSISGITPPFVVEICNVFVENCVFLYQSPPSITVPPNIYFNSLPLVFETAPVVLLKITDNKGCVVTQVKYCVENIVPPLYPYCDNCGSVEGFVSNPFADGYYADDYSPYLYLYSSGTFGNLLKTTYNSPMPTAAVGGSRAYVNGKMFVLYAIPPATGDTGIAVFDPAGTLLTTFTLGVYSVGGLTYDSSVDKVFFQYNLLPYDNRKIGYFNPNTYNVESLDVSAYYSSAYYFPGEIKTNPITFEKYAKTSDGFFNVLGAGITYPIPWKKQITGATYSFFYGTGNQPRSNVFNEETGELWLTTPRTGSTQDIVIVDPYTYGLTVVNQSCLGTSYRINQEDQAITYYPGDGTPNSSKMFVIYRNNAGTDYKIVQFDTLPPYNNSVFYNIPSTTDRQNLIYSKVYNKIIHNMFSTINAYDPTSSSVDYCPTLTTPYAVIVQPIEDPDNKLIFYLTNTNNVIWLGLDETNAVECPEKIIDFYTGNQGPYNFNEATLTWNSMCTTNVSYNTPAVNRFTIDAQTGVFATEAYLSYSSTTVNDWTPIPNIAGDVVISSDQWISGLVYNDPDSSFIVRVTFISGSCELYGPII